MISFTRTSSDRTANIFSSIHVVSMIGKMRRLPMQNTNK